MASRENIWRGTFPSARTHARTAARAAVAVGGTADRIWRSAEPNFTIHPSSATGGNCGLFRILLHPKSRLFRFKSPPGQHHCINMEKKTGLITFPSSDYTYKSSAPNVTSEITKLLSSNLFFSFCNGAQTSARWLSNRIVRESCWNEA